MTLLGLLLALNCAGILWVVVREWGLCRAEKRTGQNLALLRATLAEHPGLYATGILHPCWCAHVLLAPGCTVQCGGTLHDLDLCQPAREAMR